MLTIDQFLVVLWIGFALVLFRRREPAVAVLLVYLFGTLFLPEIQSSPINPKAPAPFRVALLEFTKVNSMSYGLFAAVLLFDPRRIRDTRYRWFDLPAATLTIMPSLSCLLNGFGPEEAFAQFRNSFLIWGVPYLMGRWYLGDVIGCRRVVSAIACGGILYLPFCWYEMRLSPLLHYHVYGFHQHDFVQAMRWGGYRPMVFMQHGLAVAFWMTTASLCFFWLWWTDCWPPMGLPANLARIGALLTLVLAASTVWCKSLGAVALGVGGLAVLWLSIKTRWRVFLAVLLILPGLYVGSRTLHWWKAEDVVGFLGSNVQKERSESLEYRLNCEELLMAVADKNPIIGYAGNPKMRPTDDDGRLVITDGLWIITYFDTGAIGLAALVGFFLLPAGRFLWIHRPDSWRDPAIAPSALCAVILGIFAIDCLFNAMLNPLYLVMAGGLNGWNDDQRFRFSRSQ